VQLTKNCTQRNLIQPSYSVISRMWQCIFTNSWVSPCEITLSLAASIIIIITHFTLLISTQYSRQCWWRTAFSRLIWGKVSRRSFRAPVFRRGQRDSWDEPPPGSGHPSLRSRTCRWWWSRWSPADRRVAARTCERTPLNKLNGAQWNDPTQPRYISAAARTRQTHLL